MEQMLLCGLGGYYQLIGKDSIEIVNNWVDSVECKDNLLCNPHTFGVAIAVQAFGLVVDQS